MAPSYRLQGRLGKIAPFWFGAACSHKMRAGGGASTEA
jgi:hypothetical protein